jgi:hypothetical protein
VLPIDEYRVIDDRTISVSVTSGDLAWTRVTSVQESSTQIAIRVEITQAPPPMADIGRPMDLVVHLSQPYAGRTVLDATGAVVSSET